MAEYCFEIQFNIPFKGIEGELKTFHTHISIENNNSIEMKVFFNPKEKHFEHIFSEWLKEVKWSNLGKYFEITKISRNDVLDIDLTNSSIKEGPRFGTNQYLNKEKYISLGLDEVVIKKPPTSEKIGSAEFFLNSAGFQMVSEYYSVLMKKTDTEFGYSRMIDAPENHRVGSFTCIPKLQFNISDSVRETKPKIEKLPIIELHFDPKKTENEVINTYALVELSSSFYFQRPIKFDFARIYLRDCTVIVVKSNDEIFKRPSSHTIWPVYRTSRIYKFIDEISFSKSSFEYINILSVIITKLNQSHSVDVRSSILLRFAILEICKGTVKQKTKQEKFIFKEGGAELKKHQVKKLMEEAKKLLIDKIDSSEKVQFEHKWNSLMSKVLLKPMISPFELYLTSIGFDIERFNIKFSEIKKIRDSLTHGSTEKFNLDELRSCNAMLYRISIGLILNYLEVKNWPDKLDIDLHS
jgi:hypothetical protein